LKLEAIAEKTQKHLKRLLFSAPCTL